MTLIAGYQGRGYCVLSTDLRVFHTSSASVGYEEKLWEFYSGNFYFTYAGTMDTAAIGRILHRSFRDNIVNPLRTYLGSLGLRGDAVVTFTDGERAIFHHGSIDITPRRLYPGDFFVMV
jgi:hypothetical protein|tara:strand:+ start:28 stop:384 length:357 start_codon:yes stop_codon:yes gene_type:complete